MKKKIIYIGLGVALFFILSMILSTIMIDSEMAVSISSGICGLYFITLTIITYSKNLFTYFKTGKFPDSSSLAIWVVSFLTITTNKNISSSIVMTKETSNSSKEFNKENNKLGIFTYTLFYVALWSFLGYIFYSFALQPNELNSISETLLSIAFISIMLATFIILCFGIFSSAKSTKSIMKNRENEYQKLKETNKFTYDLKVFKQHYGKPYYILAYLGFIGILLFILCTLYVELFDNYAPTFIVYIAGLMLMFEVFYLPVFFPVILHTLKMNSKRQQITLNPLKIKMITKDGHDGYGTYEKVEKNYSINIVESYKITNRWIILNGQIETIIRKTENSKTKEFSSILNQVKIPRIFSNENTFIEYLESILNKNNNTL